MDRILHGPCTVPSFGAGGSDCVSEENCAGESERYHGGTQQKSWDTSLGKRRKQTVCEKQMGVAVSSPNVSLSAL